MFAEGAGEGPPSLFPWTVSFKQDALGKWVDLCKHFFLGWLSKVICRNPVLWLEAFYQREASVAESISKPKENQPGPAGGSGMTWPTAVRKFRLRRKSSESKHCPAVFFCIWSEMKEMHSPLPASSFLKVRQFLERSTILGKQSGIRCEHNDVT